MLHHPAVEQLQLASVLHALADPVRLAFVRVLTVERAGINCVDTMARAGLDMPKSTCSRHFQILRRAGVVRSQRRGIELINFLREDELQRKFPELLATILDASRAEAGV